MSFLKGLSLPECLMTPLTSCRRLVIILGRSGSSARSPVACRRWKLLNTFTFFEHKS